MGVISARVLHGFGYPTGDPQNLDETGEKEYGVGHGCGSDWTPEQRGSIAKPVPVLRLRARILRCWICYSGVEESTKTPTVDDVLFLDSNLKHNAKQQIV